MNQDHNPVRILPQHIANQIAAGEVVERPASVVKELLENALDAGADRIRVDLEQGGKRLIRVSDNGCGMTRGDLDLCVERHATSKIASEQDLYAIRTHGFRGEAIPSIAAVSRLTITSRTRESDEGWQVQVCFGRDKKLRAVGCPVGTVVLAEDLFLEIPARRRFLKQDRTELSRASQVVKVMAVAYPDVLFELYSGDRCLFRSNPGAAMPGALWPLVGRQTAERLSPVRARTPGLNMEGYISGPEDAATRFSSFYLFLNKRFIQSRLVYKAISLALKGTYMKGNYPVGALFIEMDPSRVDVNVHPSKQEVRFHDEDQVFRMVHFAIKRSLEGQPSATDPANEAEGETEGKMGGFRTPPAPESRIFRPGAVSVPLPWESADSVDSAPEAAEAPQAAEPEPDYGTSTLEGFRIIGQLSGTYILVEGPDGLLLIDQHAAHEAINFKKLMEARKAKNTARFQLLAVPMVFERSPREMERFAAAKKVLLEVGIQAEEFGPGEIAIRALPPDIAGNKKAIEEILCRVMETPDSCAVENVVHDLLATIACHSSVRASQALSTREMESLLRDLLHEGVTHCPHGRPVAVNVCWNEIRRRFGR